jgi:hypothetical protein
MCLQIHPPPRRRKRSASGSPAQAPENDEAVITLRVDVSGQCTRTQHEPY